MGIPAVPIRYAEVCGSISRQDFYGGCTKILSDIYIRNDLANNPSLITKALLMRYPEGTLRGFSALASQGYLLNHEDWKPLISVPLSAPRIRNANGLVIRSADPGFPTTNGQRAVTSTQAVLDCLRMPKLWGSWNDGNSLEEQVSLLDLVGRQNVDLLMQLRKITEIAPIAGAANPLAESRPESIVRIRLHQAGLVDFRPQTPVRGQHGRYFIDLGDPFLQIGVEYQGRHHFERTARAADAQRMNDLRWAGWTILEATSTILNSSQEWAKLIALIKMERQEALARRIRRVPNKTLASTKLFDAQSGTILPN